MQRMSRSRYAGSWVVAPSSPTQSPPSVPEAIAPFESLQQPHQSDHTSRTGRGSMFAPGRNVEVSEIYLDVSRARVELSSAATWEHRPDAARRRAHQRGAGPAHRLAPRTRSSFSCTRAPSAPSPSCTCGSSPTRVRRSRSAASRRSGRHNSQGEAVLANRNTCALAHSRLGGLLHLRLPPLHVRWLSSPPSTTAIHVQAGVSHSYWQRGRGYGTACTYLWKRAIVFPETAVSMDGDAATRAT